jgi:hypothetical protein
MTRVRSTPPLSQRQVLLRAVARAVGIVLLLLLVANVSAYLIHGAVHPLRVLARKNAEQRTWERKVEEKRLQLAAMQAKKKWWSSPNGEDELAHQLGLVKEGEQTVVVTPPAPPAPTPTSVSERQAGMLGLSPTLRLTVLTLGICALVYGALLLRRRRLLRTRREAAGILTPRKQLLRQRPSE